MKKQIYFLLFTALFCSVSYSQTFAITEDGRKVLLNEDGTFEFVQESQNESISITSDEEFFIGRHTDEMSDQVYFYCEPRLLCSDKDSDKGFSLSFSVVENSNTVTISGLTSRIVGLGCLENVKIYFLFEDESKFEVTNWNKFNCEGNAWFRVSKSNIEDLGKKPLKKIRIQNGRNYEAYTHELLDADKLYFINMVSAINNQRILDKQLE